MARNQQGPFSDYLTQPYVPEQPPVTGQGGALETVMHIANSFLRSAGESRVRQFAQAEQQRERNLQALQTLMQFSDQSGMTPAAKSQFQQTIMGRVLAEVANADEGKGSSKGKTGGNPFFGFVKGLATNMLGGQVPKVKPFSTEDIGMAMTAISDAPKVSTVQKQANQLIAEGAEEVQRKAGSGLIDQAMYLRHPKIMQAMAYLDENGLDASKNPTLANLLATAAPVAKNAREQTEREIAGGVRTPSAVTTPPPSTPSGAPTAESLTPMLFAATGEPPASTPTRPTTTELYRRNIENELTGAKDVTAQHRLTGEQRPGMTYVGGRIYDRQGNDLGDDWLPRTSPAIVRPPSTDSKPILRSARVNGTGPLALHKWDETAKTFVPMLSRDGKSYLFTEQQPNFQAVPYESADGSKYVAWEKPPEGVVPRPPSAEPPKPSTAATSAPPRPSVAPVKPTATSGRPASPFAPPTQPPTPSSAPRGAKMTRPPQGLGPAALENIKRGIKDGQIDIDHVRTYGARSVADERELNEWMATEGISALTKEQIKALNDIGNLPSIIKDMKEFVREWDPSKNDYVAMLQGKAVNPLNMKAYTTLNRIKAKVGIVARTLGGELRGVTEPDSARAMGLVDPSMKSRDMGNYLIQRFIEDAGAIANSALGGVPVKHRIHLFKQRKFQPGIDYLASTEEVDF